MNVSPLLQRICVWANAVNSTYNDRNLLLLGVLRLICESKRNGGGGTRGTPRRYTTDGSFGDGLREAPDYAAFPIRNIFVEQAGHTAWVAGRPFFIVMACGLPISLLVRYFTQYASKVFPQPKPESTEGHGWAA